MVLILSSNSKDTISSNTGNTSEPIIPSETEQVNVEGPYVEVIDGKLPSELNVADEFLKNTIHLFDTVYTGKYFGYYFKEDSMLVKNMDPNVIINIAIQGFANKLLKIGNKQTEVCVEKKEILDYARTVLDKQVPIRDITEEIYNDTGDFAYRDGKYCGKLLEGKDPIGDNIYHRVIAYSKEAFI